MNFRDRPITEFGASDRLESMVRKFSETPPTGPITLHELWFWLNTAPKGAILKYCGKGIATEGRAVLRHAKRVRAEYPLTAQEAAYAAQMARAMARRKARESNGGQPESQPPLS